MVPSLGSERASVQDPLIGYAEEIGWNYLTPDAALTLRRGESGTLLYEVLRDKLIALNPDMITVDNVDQVLNRIESVRNTIEGNAEILAWLRGEKSIRVATEKRERNVTVIDFDHPAHNLFHVTDEWQYTNGQHRNRADVMFLINGVPLALVETKSPKLKEGIEEGVKQIRRYHRETPEMLTAPQVFDITHLLDFYYGVTWNLERKDIFKWKDEEKGNFERKVKRFFAREWFLKLIQEWIIFFQRDDEVKKIVLRQHQTRAIEKILERALDPEKKRGLIWHTQGSGKTFTMIKVAELLLENPIFQKPTVIMLVDRNELEGQLSGWVAGVLDEKKAVLATSKQNLRELLRSDTRGTIISMVHKFDRADAGLCKRSNVFILVDEAHRTTGGDLGNYLVAALPHATMIGFTGTPIDKIAYGKGTFKVFGKDDPQGYLDKYSIAESIDDGTTLHLNYTLTPNDIRVPPDLLESEFFALAETEGISDIEELNRILEKSVRLKVFLKSRDRVDKVAHFVADHYRKNVEPLEYKAFLVGIDREACALYKKALDKYLPQDYSTVVYTTKHNDEPGLAKYHLSETAEKRVRKNFRKPNELPKILIVTEKLLTGYDAPILYCMYLDKPMRDHTLLQAIARVNRPYEQEGERKKPAGFVVDFVGIFGKLEKALAFDSDVVGSVIQNLDVLKETFTRLMRKDAVSYLALCKGPFDDKTVEQAIDTLAEKEKRERFYSFFKEVESLYEIISPDPCLREHLDDYRKLSELYMIIRNRFSKQPELYKEVANKTELLIRDSASTYVLDRTLPVVSINATTLAALKKTRASRPSKVINLGKSLIQSVMDEAPQQPYLVPIGERAEAVLEEYDQRQTNTQDALRDLEKLIDEYVSAQEEQKKAGVDVNTFTLYWMMKQEGLKEAEDLAPVLNEAFQRFPNHAHNSSELRLLKAELYKVLLPAIGKERMVDLADRILRLQRK